MLQREKQAKRSSDELKGLELHELKKKLMGMPLVTANDRCETTGTGGVAFANISVDTSVSTVRRARAATRRKRTVAAGTT